MTAPLSALPATEAPTERSLPGARFRITFEDGAEHTVRLAQRDYVAWDKTAARHKWGSSKDSPFLFASFLAYTAGKRDGLVPDGQSFDAFLDAVADISPVTPEVEGEDDIRPTR